MNAMLRARLEMVARQVLGLEIGLLLMMLVVFLLAYVLQ